MTGFEFGTIVLVRFPFTDQRSSKQCPAVVVSSAAYNQARPDVILMAATSRLRHRSDFGEIGIDDGRPPGYSRSRSLAGVVHDRTEADCQDIGVAKGEGSGHTQKKPPKHFRLTTSLEYTRQAFLRQMIEETRTAVATTVNARLTMFYCADRELNQARNTEGRAR